MKDTESTDLIYQLESKSFFLYLAGRKKEFQQLLYVDYFLSRLKRIFMGTGNGLVKNLLAPGQCSQKSLKDPSWSINICSTEPLY